MAKLKSFILGIILLFAASAFAQTNSVTNVTIVSGMTVTTITTTIINAGTNLGVNLMTPIAANNVPLTTNASVPVATNIMQVVGLNTNVQKITQSFLNNFIDAAPYLKNNIINADFAGLYNMSSTLSLKQRIGWFGGIDLPIGQQGALGGGILYLDQHYDLVPLTLKAGTTIKWPLIGTVYNYITTGPLLSLKDSQFGSYNFLGGVKKWDLSKRWDLSLGGGIGNVSIVKGLDFDLTLRLNLHW